MIVRRMWHEGDPEPDDHPYLIDQRGEVWIYDNAGDDDLGLWPGWWAPFVDTQPCPWEDVFTTHGARELTECTKEETREIDEELFS